jgi:hypothetical protein
VGLLELLLAEVGAHLAEAVLAVVGLELLPRLSSWVKEGLRGAVERGLYRFRTRRRGCDLRFGWMSWLRQYRGSWLFVCST